MSRGGAERGGERESQAGSALSVPSPTWGSIPRPWDHDLSRNQELDAQLIEQFRCPWDGFSILTPAEAESREKIGRLGHLGVKT